MSESVPDLVDGDIHLRPFGLDDVDDLVALWSDPEVARWTDAPRRPTRALAAAWIGGRPQVEAAGIGLDWAVAGPDGFMGAIGLADVNRDAGRADLGYSIAPSHRRQGLAGRVVHLVVTWAFGELGLVAVHVDADVGNVASRCVAERAGFTTDGHTRAYRHPEGGERLLVRYTLAAPATQRT